MIKNIKVNMRFILLYSPILSPVKHTLNILFAIPVYGTQTHTPTHTHTRAHILGALVRVRLCVYVWVRVSACLYACMYV